MWGTEFTTKAATQQGGLAVVLRPLFGAALVVRRRYLIMVPRPMPAAPRRYLIFMPKPLPAAPLVERRSYLIVVPSLVCPLCVVGT